MPMHDWTRVDSGTYHDFHQDWTIQIRRMLNRGILPDGYIAMADQKVSDTEPDSAVVRERGPSGGLTVTDAPPRAALVRQSKAESAAATYARKANRIVVRNRRGMVVAAIEVVSPGNKDSRDKFRSFLAKAVGFLQNGIHLLVIDPFPPTNRDPSGIHAAIWEEITDEPSDPPPAGKPLAVTAYDAGDDDAYPLTAYHDPIGVGDALPDAALFLAPGWYVKVPLEAAYVASWAETPRSTQALLTPSAG